MAAVPNLSRQVTPQIAKGSHLLLGDTLVLGFWVGESPLLSSVEGSWLYQPGGGDSCCLACPWDVMGGCAWCRSWERRQRTGHREVGRQREGDYAPLSHSTSLLEKKFQRYCNCKEFQDSNSTLNLELRPFWVSRELWEHLSCELVKPPQMGQCSFLSRHPFYWSDQHGIVHLFVNFSCSKKKIQHRNSLLLLFFSSSVFRLFLEEPHWAQVRDEYIWES